MREKLKKVLNLDIDELYAPVGCDKCINGYKGRIAIHEVLKINQDPFLTFLKFPQVWHTLNLN